ncbi:MAG: hypothetical protein KIT09_09615 [Bryobacteraceae bacterium]|nr:hypothetical protein [Bryobacteraceae bacterium]
MTLAVMVASSYLTGQFPAAVWREWSTLQPESSRAMVFGPPMPGHC